MVQFLPPTTKGRLTEESGKAFTSGISEVLDEAREYKRNRGRLQDALKSIENISPEDRRNPTKLLTSILSATAGIPGAERYVGSVFDTLVRQQNTQAQKEAAKGRRQQTPPPTSLPTQGPEESTQTDVQQPGVPLGEAYFREPKAPSSPEGLFPATTAGYKPEPEMGPDELNDYAANLVETSGGQMDWNSAYAAAQTQNTAIRDRNDKQLQQQQNRATAIENQSAAMVGRARDAKLLGFPGAETIAANAAFQARNAQTPEQQWQYVQTQLKKGEDAYNGLVREVGPTGPLGKIFRQGIGSYKSKEQTFNDIQPYLNYYRENGLFNEARGILSGDLGLGAEDVETALFPPSEQEKKLLEKFPMNADRIQPKPTGRIGPQEDLGNVFPDERYKADETGFNILKKHIADYLKTNPQANLISLRGRLNQDKKYYWGDISNALQQLADEKAFGTKSGRPDQVQQQQMQVIKQAPIPSLWNQFQYYWKGKK